MRFKDKKQHIKEVKKLERITFKKQLIEERRKKLSSDYDWKKDLEGGYNES